MSKRTFIISIFLSSFFGGILTYLLFSLSSLPQNLHSDQSITERQELAKNKVHFIPDSDYIVPEGLNFLSASSMVIPAVVHIQTFSDEPFGLDNIFGSRPNASGSGIILTEDGYIATNQHVINKAGRIEVILNDNRSYSAKLIGEDMTTDLALLKIQENHLPFVKFGNSDEVKAGEWVLAIGNPFDLNSTVTAGIVSAKARNIGILRQSSQLQIESFIQTDAAVNPGNSGGALVNLKGELIGINTAIASETGSYQGYSFAIPSLLAEKVLNDILEFGKIQRGLLGVRIGDVNARIAEMYDLSVLNGILISSINRNSAAEEAGLESGDVIMAIDDYTVNNTSELQERVARKRPGDRIKVTYLRNQEAYDVVVQLKDLAGGTSLEKATYENTIEGATFGNLEESDLDAHQIIGGVRIDKMEDGKWKEAGLEQGFIITFVDKVPIFSVEEMYLAMRYKKGGVLIEGFYPGEENKSVAVDW
ncbi:MAG: trypsin-like peptidase domain-containing protein [Cyclobacteriaceae bacterium]|nr:trypsin-like peptidase domain-containing protein [Cyclobacteriaceae bacterium]